MDSSVWGEVGTCWVKNEKWACQFPVDCKKILKKSFGRLCLPYWIKVYTHCRSKDVKRLKDRKTPNSG